MTIRIATLALACAMTAAGCSTHEEKFAKDAPPERPDAGQLTRASNELVTAPEEELASQPPEALVALTQAAAAQFDATGAPGMRDLVRRYGKYLLRARVSAAQGGVGYYAASDPRRVDVEVTLRAGLALIDAYEVTGDRVFADAIVPLTGAVTSPPFGWTAYRGGAGIVDTRAPKSGVDVAWTALAAAFLSRAASVTDAPTTDLAAQAMRTVDRGQAAVGRWYARLPSGSPMNLHQWATTLEGLQYTESGAAQGILGAGVPALYAGAFRPNGEPRRNRFTKASADALALSYGVLARYRDERLSSAAFPKLVGKLRDDGTVRLAPRSDAEAQALYGYAVAAEVAALKRDE